MRNERNPDRFKDYVARAKTPEPPKSDVAAALFTEHLDLAAIRQALGRKAPAEPQPNEFAPPALRAAARPKAPAGPEPSRSPEDAPVAPPSMAPRPRRIRALAAWIAFPAVAALAAGVALSTREAQPDRPVPAELQLAPDLPPDPTVEATAPAQGGGGSASIAANEPRGVVAAAPRDIAAPAAPARQDAPSMAIATGQDEGNGPTASARQDERPAIVATAPREIPEPAVVARQDEAPAVVAAAPREVPEPAVAARQDEPPAVVAAVPREIAEPAVAARQDEAPAVVAAAPREIAEPAVAARQDEAPAVVATAPREVPEPAVAARQDEAPAVVAAVPREIAEPAVAAGQDEAPAVVATAPREIAEPAFATRQNEAPAIVVAAPREIAEPVAATRQNEALADQPPPTLIPDLPQPRATDAPQLPPPGSIVAAESAVTWPDPPRPVGVAAPRADTATVAALPAVATPWTVAAGAQEPTAAGPDPASAPTPLPRPVRLATIATQAPGPPTPSLTRAAQARLVVHYSGIQPAPARAPVDAALRAAGFARVEWREVPFGVSSTNARYFHAGDRGVTGEAVAALSRAGYATDLRDFTTYSPPPSIGTVELWLAR